MTIVFDSSPMPNQMMNSGSSASLGIGRVVSIGLLGPDFFARCGVHLGVRHKVGSR